MATSEPSTVRYTKQSYVAGYIWHALNFSQLVPPRPPMAGDYLEVLTALYDAQLEGGNLQAIEVWKETLIKQHPELIDLLLEPFVYADDRTVPPPQQ